MLLHRKINPEIKNVVFISAGLISVVIGMNMAFESQMILYVILSLFTGGILGSVWKIEDRILHLGSFLERHFTPAGRRMASLGFQPAEKALPEDGIIPAESSLTEDNSDNIEHVKSHIKEIERFLERFSDDEIKKVKEKIEALRPAAEDETSEPS